jgi:small subunit ribosomal protein S2
VARLNKEKTKLEKNLGGIKEMKDLPGIVFVIDTKKETNAVEEAKKMGIPIVAVVDTNCNPQGIDFPIPGNDDAIRAITLFTQIIANAVIEAENEAGLEVIESLQEEDIPGAKVETASAEFDAVVDKSEFVPEEPVKDKPVIEDEFSAYIVKDEEPSAVADEQKETKSDTVPAE